MSLRIWSSVGHGEKSWLGVGDLEVLIGELLTVDGLATGTLHRCELLYVCMGEVEDVRFRG